MISGKSRRTVGSPPDNINTPTRPPSRSATAITLRSISASVGRSGTGTDDRGSNADA
jgi:hypothetical protein